jgi:GntR family transcriptional regulator/MocR family aminotransferase
MAAVVALTPRAGVPLHRQLYDAIRQAIVAGRLRPGVRLPSTRALAEQLNVSRNPAMNAFEQLLAEGYIVGRAGSGTYVADHLPERATAARKRPIVSTPATPPAASRAARSVTLTAILCPFRRGPETAAPPAAFRLGAPDSEHFPFETWGRLLTRRWNRSAHDLLADTGALGYAPLRHAVCDYVSTARGVQCTPEQVLIVAGTQQALSLTAQVLLDPGQTAWMEDPGYPGAHGALIAAGVKVAPVPVDEEGFDVATALRHAPDARLAVVTPAHQMPMGVPLHPRRRVELLDWARQADAWIFEDDYDSEYRYTGRPLPALQGEPGGADRVIYCGTFSKVLSPALRLAYVVVPPALVEPFATAKAFADVHCPPLEQAVLTDFITQGHFARHVRRTRVLYARRQALLLRHAARELAGLLNVRPMDAGMHVLGYLLTGADDQEVSRRLRAANVNAMPLSNLAIAAKLPPALILGYAGVPDKEILAAVRRMRDVLI